MAVSFFVYYNHYSSGLALSLGKVDVDTSIDYSKSYEGLEFSFIRREYYPSALF